MSENGQKRIADIAGRHGVSNAAATELLSAIAAGGGGQAQFDHPELGGMGQWSQGGMIMIGDMFNAGLKARVAALCGELADALQGSALFAPGERPNDPRGTGRVVPHTASHRWPAELGTPAATGSQNDLHYAVFPTTRRLAIAQHGRVTVYDTGDHRIGGVSQQQAADQSLRFTSQSGAVKLSDLPIVGPAPEIADAPAPSGAKTNDALFSSLERLADLHRRDIISAEEFATKKAELLARL